MARLLCAQVFAVPPLNPTAKAVLMALSTFASARTLQSYPGIDSLAAGLGLSRRTVQRALRELEDAGQIERIAYGSGGKGKATVYKLTCIAPNGDTDDTVSDAPNGDTDDAVSGAAQPDQTATPTTPYRGSGNGDTDDTVSPKGRHLRHQRVSSATSNGDTHDAPRAKKSQGREPDRTRSGSSDRQVPRNTTPNSAPQRAPSGSTIEQPESLADIDRDFPTAEAREQGRQRYRKLLAEIRARLANRPGAIVHNPNAPEEPCHEHQTSSPEQHEKSSGSSAETPNEPPPNDEPPNSKPQTPSSSTTSDAATHSTPTGGPNTS